MGGLGPLGFSSPGKELGFGLRACREKDSRMQGQKQTVSNYTCRSGRVVRGLGLDKPLSYLIFVGWN